MFQRSCDDGAKGGRNFTALRGQVRWLFVLLPAVGALMCHGGEGTGIVATEEVSARPRHFLTNSAQFKTLGGRDYLNECAFDLTGVLTLVDTNRNLVVLQDASGAIAVNFRGNDNSLEAGQSVTVRGTNCHPYVVSFPDYPYSPSGHEIQPTFEAPSDWGDFHLTRMRGYLHPRVSGDYTFWIASDNSSELWLSASDDPARAKRIAFLPRYNWVGPREWTRFPSQHSESVYLTAGKRYYIEALQEQNSGGDHLAVGWRGPGIGLAVIDGAYLTPWFGNDDPSKPASTNGILREYWTNYAAGNLAALTGRSFESALSAENVQVQVHGRGELPKPLAITLNQRLRPDENFRWVEVEGRVKFAGIDRDSAFLELSDGQMQIQVRASHWNPDLSQAVRHLPIRVEGVCEAVYDRNGILVPGLIWASVASGVSLSGTEETNVSPLTVEQASSDIQATNLPQTGYYGTRGVVTFNDRVLGKDYLFVQEESAAVFVSFKDRHLKNQLKVGQYVDVGGSVEPGKPLQVISPLVVNELGWRSMPIPMAQPRQPIPPNIDGRWAEIEGIVHSVSADGTMSVMGRGGPIHVWLGGTPAEELSRYVDAKLRIRGVLSLAVPDAPRALVPSGNFVEVEKEAPRAPFGIAASVASDVFSDEIDPSSAHRAKFVGVVTYRDKQSFFIQDGSDGLRVQALGDPGVKVDETVEVIGFPAASEPAPTLVDAIVRPVAATRRLEPKKLDLSEAVPFRNLGTVVHVSATLLQQKARGTVQVLELQEQQRVFEATLENDLGQLPSLTPGSRLKVTGMCDYETVSLAAPGRTGMEKSSTGPLNIRLRGAADLAVLRGPPWWTWRRTVALVGSLLAVLTGALLWVHLLARRLERQQTAQTVFSQKILQNLESERSRIAGNLHDGLGQNLLVIKNQALMALQKDADESVLRQRLDEISGVASQAIEEVRQITHGLRPYQLDRLGLTQAIRTTVSRASANSSIQFASRTEDVDTVFDKESEIHVYRIVQEGVNNVVKHSSATEAVVVIKKRDGFVSLSIRDNGVGFDVGSVRSSHLHDIGYGLSGITERVRILKGSLTIDSRPGGGTNVSVEVPIPTRNHDATNDATNDDTHSR